MIILNKKNKVCKYLLEKILNKKNLFRRREYY